MSDIRTDPVHASAYSPIDPPAAWTTHWSEILDTGSWRNALPVHAWRPSPCHVACPVGGSIPTWIKQLADGDPAAAWQTLVEPNPLPAVTGRVCHSPCESDCNRATFDGAVSINALEQALADQALAEAWKLPAPQTSQGKRVAVVGGGPAGLSCAYQLRRLGYDVVVFEARDQLGGTLRYGIPAYRLPRAVLDAEVGRLLAFGIEARTGSPVDDLESLNALERDFDAVFLALGAQRARSLGHLAGGPAGDRMVDGLAFLQASNTWPAGGRAAQSAPTDPATLGPRIAVIGGGSAAMDVARTALRLGKTVAVICLEPRDAMLAQEAEVVEALEEGMALFAGAAVAAVEVETDGLTLSCHLVTLDPAAARGTVLASPMAGSEFRLSADTIVVSIGQDPELGGLPLVVTEDTRVVAVDPETMASERPGVFAGGDVAGLSRYVSQAIGDGRRAALGIAAYLGHAEVAPAPSPPTLDQAVGFDEVNTYYFDERPRAERDRAPADERLSDFREIARTLTPAQAAAEAERCFSCGTCIRCDNCVVYCPDMAVIRADTPRESQDSPAGIHYAVLDQYCKGCGLCVAECPRGAVRLEQESR